jgi:GTP-binding protein
MLHTQAGGRVATAELNRWIREFVERSPPPPVGARRGKILYATQIGTRPPTVVLKCNDAKAFPGPYVRFLENALRDVAPFAEVPIHLVLDGRPDKVAD